MLQRQEGVADLDKGVDGENNEVRLVLGVVHQVKVDELLLLQVVRLHVLEDVREEGRDILRRSYSALHSAPGKRENHLANCHGGDGLFDRFLAHRGVVAVELDRELKVLSLLQRRRHLPARLRSQSDHFEISTAQPLVFFHSAR